MTSPAFRRPPNIQVERGVFATGVWWSASVTVAAEFVVTSGYRRTRYAAVRSLECKLKRIRNDAARAADYPNIVKARRGDCDVEARNQAPADDEPVGFRDGVFVALSDALERGE